MSLLRNKHVLTASIVAPILALIAYFGIELLVGEKPQPAAAGQSYELMTKPNCRRSGGLCGLKNGDFELNLEVEWINDDRFVVNLTSAFPLEGVMISLDAEGDDESHPIQMQPESDDGRTWALALTRPGSGSDRLRLVASANQSIYYSDASTKFLVIDGER